MKIRKLETTQGILSLIDQQVDGIAIDVSEKNILSGGLFDISLEHGKSIATLFEQSLFVSGYSLIRPMFESFIRAAWLQYCATDAQVSRVVTEGTYPLTIEQLVEELEKIHYESSTFSRITTIYDQNLDSYTNGGLELVFRRFSNEQIVHRSDAEEIRSILNLVLLISFLSFCSIADLAKEPDNQLDFIYDIQQSIFERFSQ